MLLWFFFLSQFVFNSFFKIPVKIENARLKHALTIPTSASITVANDAMKCYQFLQIKQLMNYENSQKKNVFTKPFAH